MELFCFCLLAVDALFFLFFILILLLVLIRDKRLNQPKQLIWQISINKSTLKRAAENLLLFAIAALVPFISYRIGSWMSVFFRNSLEIHISPYVLQFAVVFLAAWLSSVLVRKLGLRKRIVVLQLLVFILFALLYSRYEFYYYQANPDFGDIQHVPECMKETNFETYWEYLVEGCHLTVWDLVRSLGYKIACWVVTFFGGDFLIRRMKQKKANPELIDE